MGWRDWVVDRLCPDLVAERVREALDLAAEDRGWRALAGAAPREVPYRTVLDRLNASAEAYRENPLAFRIVELTTDYVLGRGIRLRSPDPAVQGFVDAWWTHPQNRLAVRQFELCTELSLAGDLFVALHRNPYDGMTYLRPIPAAMIDQVETDPDDVETELRYHQLAAPLAGGGAPSTLNPQPSAGERWWEAADLRHYAINRLPGATRGQGDLFPLLPWLARYREWLTDRLRINRFKGAFVWEVELRTADRRAALARQAELAAPPNPGSVLVHDQTESWRALQPNIDAQDAEPDGRALRLMIAAGAGLPLHFLAEPDGSNRATAAEMGGPTLRHFERRQLYLGWVFADLALEAVRRSARFGEGRPVTVEAEFEDLSARENAQAAAATRAIVDALATAANRGWIDDTTARRLIAKYAGEAVPIDDPDDDRHAPPPPGGSRPGTQPQDRVPGRRTGGGTRHPARVGGRVVVARGG
ncbi:MAG TPA: hypothetical protein VG370_03740 [Chloroflexota bacterium]|jgi:hypothetical protein|nr:hypothetical protein [Chloroflexota bacterium]